MKNPALSQELRYEPASVIPLKQESSLIDWLKANNRLIPREPKEKESFADSEDPEIDELMSNEEDFEEDEDFDLED
ncbi:MAG: DUF3134 domain-containing protein [Xenococcaceae cyanobacterium]